MGTDQQYQVIKDLTFDDQAVYVHSDPAVCDEIVRPVEWALSINPFSPKSTFPVPGTKGLRIILTEKGFLFPRVRVFYSVDESQMRVFMHWIEVVSDEDDDQTEF